MHVVTPTDTLAGQPAHDGYRLPAPASIRLQWVPPGKALKFAGATIPGPLYFGRPADGQEAEPSAIDLDQQVAAVGDCFRVSRALWASYRTLTPAERRGYIDWMAGGREHPDVDMRLVYMYLYGIERRLVVDLAKDEAVRAELPAIETELLRLRDLYADRDKTVQTAVDGLLYWVHQPGAPASLHKSKDLVFRRIYGLRVYTEVAVGQAVHARHPLSSKLVLAWLLESGASYIPADCKPYRAQFDALFDDLFTAVYPAGMHVQPPPGHYELQYRPASPGLTGHPLTSRPLADAADTTKMAEPLQLVKSIFKAAQSEIERYAKLMARCNEGGFVRLDELQSLPMRLWPDTRKASLRNMVERVSQGAVAMRAADVLSAIHPETKFSKASAQIVLSILQNMGLTTDPLLVGDARAVKADAWVAVIPTDLVEEESQAAEAYSRAACAITMTVAVAAAAGPLPEPWLTWLDEQIAVWHEDALAGSALLRARARLIATDPQPISVFKKIGTEGLDADAIARLAARGACAVGEPAAASVKALEKLYQALGLDPKRVPADLHDAAAGVVRRGTKDFVLDVSRIAALQQDTERVSKVLSEIFVQEPEPAEPAPAAAALLSPVGDALLGLDAKHASFARALLAQAAWTRDAIVQVATSFGLMPDGALERINDACFDQHDMPFSEGDDPIEINPDLLEILS